MQVAQSDYRDLTDAEVSRLVAHLREQYRGVFDEQMIRAHVGEFVQSRFADSLAAVVAASGAPGDTLLDIGCGYGAFVLSCRRQGLDAIGYELEAFEVAFARQRLQRIAPAADAGTVFQKGDAGRLPFADKAFSTVTLLNVLEHVPDYRAVLAEAVRVVRPGGRLLVVCPNYAAFRREAHYHVPWLPFLPRAVASRYLRWLGRNPAFFETSIHYCTNWGVMAALRQLGMRTASLDVLRLDHPELFAGARTRQALQQLRGAGLMPLLKAAYQAAFRNPFKSSVMIVATRPAP